MTMINSKAYRVLLPIAVLAAGLLAAPVASAIPATAPATTISAPATTASDTALGKRLADKFFRILKSEDSAALAAFLSPAFQVARANGTTSTKRQYLKDPAVVDDYVLDDFLVTRADDALVVRYTVTTTEIIDGEEFKTDPALRLSVFHENDRTDRWQLLSHANFNSVATPA